MRFTQGAAILFLTGLGLAVSRAGDPMAELASFSIFDKVDLAELSKGEAKTTHGPPMGGRFLSVQSCYVMPGAPARQLEALRQWNPTGHRELKVFLHGDLPVPPSPADFSKFKNAPANRAVSFLVSATEKMSAELQVSKEEAATFSPGPDSSGGTMPASVANFWTNLLANRAKLFISGGTAGQPPYDHSGKAIRPNDDLKALLKQQDKIRRQFSEFLGNTGIGRGAGSLAPDPYWELVNIDDRGVVTLGASYSRAGGGSGPAQAADVLYYASGGYYVALTLHQMWPVTVEGKPATLVWRGDMISSAELESLHGVERLASESAMAKDISKAINLFRRDSGGPR